MKRTVIFLLVFALFLFSSCTQGDVLTKTEAETNTTQETLIAEVEHTTQEQTTVKDIGGGTMGLSKYRDVYYGIPRPFVNLVDKDEYKIWYEEIIKNNPNETNLMIMKLFVQEYHITREQFDKANLDWAKIVKNDFHSQPVIDPQDYANQETDEIYNGDIIYTFDDEIINNYYLSHDYPYCYVTEFEEAVEKGEYVSQTKNWIDIAEMEAEIIAKYGTIEYETKSQLRLDEINGIEG